MEKLINVPGRSVLCKSVISSQVEDGCRRVDSDVTFEGDVGAKRSVVSISQVNVRQFLVSVLIDSIPTQKR